MKIRCATKKPFHLVHGQPMKQPIQVAARALRVQHSKWKQQRLSWHQYLWMDNEFENSVQYCTWTVFVLQLSWSDKEIYNNEDLQAACGFCSVGQIEKGCRLPGGFSALPKHYVRGSDGEQRAICCATWHACPRQCLLRWELKRLPPVWCEQGAHKIQICLVFAHFTPLTSPDVQKDSFISSFFSSSVMEELFSFCEGWRS